MDGARQISPWGKDSRLNYGWLSTKTSKQTLIMLYILHTPKLSLKQARAMGGIYRKTHPQVTQNQLVTVPRAMPILQCGDTPRHQIYLAPKRRSDLAR